MTDPYQDFLARKISIIPPVGIEPPILPAQLKPFQRDITAWALRRGRAALFQGTGTGKTFEQLSWARAIADHTQGRVLILAPLGVAFQTVEEAVKWGIPGVAYARYGLETKTDITVTNYERRDNFDIGEFAGIVLDESSIIKSDDSKTRAELIEAAQSVLYRLCCTATPAPNDWTELGNHAEFLGVMTAKEMLAMYFVHEGAIRAGGPDVEEWRLKKHATRAFWKWVASWAIMLRDPNKFGYDEPSYILPPLNLEQITVKSDFEPSIDNGLFQTDAGTLSERISARRETVEDRVRAAACIISEFSAKLAICGNQNTLPIVAENIKLILPNEKNENLKEDHQKKTLLTCENTTLTINQNSNVLPNNGIKLMPPDVSDMLLMKTTETQPSQCQKLDQKKNAAIPLCEKTTVSIVQNMTRSLQAKAESAQSAEVPKEMVEDINFTLITATQQNKLEESSAPTATLGLANLTTTSILSPAQLNTLKTGENQWVIWCGLNKEQDALEAIFRDRCFSVYGTLSSDEKISRVNRWLRGERQILISKVSIIGFGMNFQQCNKMIYVGLNDSFEQLFQSIRRCWRFGQTRPVTAWLVSSEREGAVVANLRRKEEKYEAMAAAMEAEMQEFCIAQLRTDIKSGREIRDADKNMELPSWLR